MGERERGPVSRAWGHVLGGSMEQVEKKDERGQKRLEEKKEKSERENVEREDDKERENVESGAENLGEDEVFGTPKASRSSSVVDFTEYIERRKRAGRPTNKDMLDKERGLAASKRMMAKCQSQIRAVKLGKKWKVVQ